MSVQNDDSKANITHFQLVGDFHNTFDHPIRKEPYIEFFQQDSKIPKFRVALMREELKELIDAFQSNDLIEMADALCDLAYVTYGAGHCLGINLDNLASVMNVDLSTSNNFDHVDMNSCVSQRIVIINDMILIENIINILDGDMGHIKDIFKMAKSLVEILAYTYALGHKLRFKMDQMFREVHRSNMTKVCLTITDADESVYFYKNDPNCLYKNPSIKTKGQYFVIYDANTSKILKNHRWESPNLNQFF